MPRNRDKYINKVNEADMLISMQDNMIKGIRTCIIDVITGELNPCEFAGLENHENCEQCIRIWLNEEG